MQGLGTTGPTGQRRQLSPNNYLGTINDHLIQAVQVVYFLFRNSQSLRYIAIPLSEIAIEITFKFLWSWLFERLSPIYWFQPCLSLNTQIISNQNQKISKPKQINLIRVFSHSNHFLLHTFTYQDRFSTFLLRIWIYR
jgi:hypothetical protein